ncbi:putative conidiation-specific expression protein [Neurospora tetraspora]|uniref:Conidiation-specific expression protein n=1 Tax=Neurospora tetraspora TaxID=94610 RepID=A0AAE0J1L3_9PEZI|nr:putative conidiation-specific expression protein [Neurospora tetraspora]
MVDYGATNSSDVPPEPYDQSSSDNKKTTDQGEKDPGNVARGLKAAISNPGVSEEAKKNAKKKLEGLQ